MCSARAIGCVKLPSWVLLMVTVVCLRCCNAVADPSTDVPVMVSTVSRFTIGVYDMTVDSNGNILYVSSSRNGVYRLAANGSVVLLAGSSSGTGGAADGVGSLASFNLPRAITCDTANNIVYIADNSNCRIRTLILATNNVTTLAGSSLGYRNGIGCDAQFAYPWGIVFHSSGVLYITENYYSGGAYYSNIRKIFVAVANVTTVVPSVGYYFSYNLCVNTLGTVLYVSTSYIILQVDASSGMKIPLAGSFGVEGSRDGVGTVALFNGAAGIALNSNESALIIADVNGLRIRMLEIASRNVTTIAGSSAGGSRDGPGLTATFSFPYGVKWYCNVSLASCDVCWSLTPTTMRCASCQLRVCRLQQMHCQWRQRQRCRTRSQILSLSRPHGRCPHRAQSVPQYQSQSTSQPPIPGRCMLPALYRAPKLEVHRLQMRQRSRCR